MLELMRQMLTGQYEASLKMVDQCITACRPEHWEGRIANDSFRYVAYHTLFFTDMYLSRSQDEFTLRDLHDQGGDERGEGQSVGLSRDKTIVYVTICRMKMHESLAAETAESLQEPSGFSWRKFSRAEMHVYNIRHIQHHAGQMSAYLRRVDPALAEPAALPWVGSGWK
ncbi:MAG TPA: DinB family protein [Tepidisphaeraceae bacterium]|nr:DinB family protein [Tepidisphaeraceae bacterium]